MLTPQNKLTFEPIISPPRNKFITIYEFRLSTQRKMKREHVQTKWVVDGEEFQTIVRHDNLEEELEVNLDQVIDNIQVELVEHVVLIT